MIIYCVENILNQKKYIGKTISKLNNRKVRHLSAIRKGKENVYFHNAIRKEGEDNFRWGILCECSSLNELSQKEKYFIALYQTNNRDFGYNLTKGGEGCEGFKHSEEAKKIMSIKKKGIIKGKNNPMYGKHHSEKMKKEQSERMKGKNNPHYGKKRSKLICKKISESNKGKIITEETKKKLSEAMKGKHHSEETKKKISKASKGRLHTEETKKWMKQKALLRKRNEKGLFISEI